MCFSATASFTSGVVLSTLGVQTLTKVNSKKEIPFASLPLLFGLQQITEGFVWISISESSSTCTTISSYGFLFFAFILWPALIPFVASYGESNKLRRKIFNIFQFGGILVSLYFLYFLSTIKLSTFVIKNSISYYLPSPYQFEVAGAYVFFTCGSLLFSKKNIIRNFGAISTVAVAITYYNYRYTFTSVWCFFAAILSLTIYWHFYRQSKKVMKRK